MKEQYLQKIKTGELKKMARALGISFTGKQSKNFLTGELLQFSYNKLIETYNSI